MTKQYSIMVVGEYLSRKDAEEGGPFRSGHGRMFKSWMRQVGIEPRDCFFTNVFTTPPEGRQSLLSYCGSKEEGIPNVKYLKRGKYVKAKYEPQLKILWEKIEQVRPNLIIACGDAALWALTSEKSLAHSRGRINHGHSALPAQKILPTYAPAQIMADYTQRPILLADLEKAKRESLFPEIVRPQRFLHLYPSLEDMEDFLNEYIIPSPKLDCDIESIGQTITCVSFAPSPDRVLVVPFYDEETPSGNYWKTEREEYLAWQWIRRVAKLDKAVCGQNFQYDIQYFWRLMGIKWPSFGDDTMLMHHALQPEMRKGLGFLASVYTDELPWKFMHKVAAADKTGKKEDDA